MVINFKMFETFHDNVLQHCNMVGPMFYMLAGVNTVFIVFSICFIIIKRFIYVALDRKIIMIVCYSKCIQNTTVTRNTQSQTETRRHS